MSSDRPEKSKAGVEKEGGDELSVVKKEECNKADPVAWLNEECMIHIISFLWSLNADDKVVIVGNTGGDKEDTVRLTKTMSFHFWLSAVSSKWRKLMNKSIVQIVPGQCVNIDHNFLASEDIHASWLFQHKRVPIKAIRCFQGNGHASTIKCLEGFETAQIKQVGLGISIPDHEDGKTLSTQQCLQDQIALQCPNLNHLHLIMSVEEGCVGANVEKLISPSLFRCSSITSLSINLDLLATPIGGNSLCGQFFAKTTQNFPALQNLWLESQHDSLVPMEDGDGAFHISSKSLRWLMIANLCTEQVRLSLDCPQLTTLDCKARMLDPLQYGPDIFRINQQVTQAESVPEECIVYLKCQKAEVPAETIHAQMVFHSDCFVGAESVMVRFAPAEAADMNVA